MLAILSGVGMLALGIARLGSLVRFVPSSVLVGFVNAVAINIILSQVDEVTGYQSEASNRVLKALDTVVHPGQIQWASVVVAALTIGLIVLLERTRLGALGMVVAIALGSALPVVLDAWAPRCWPSRCSRTSSPCPGACPAWTCRRSAWSRRWSCPRSPSSSSAWSRAPPSAAR